MTENKSSQILKPGRILGVFVIILLFILLAITAITASWEYNQSKVIFDGFRVKLTALMMLLAFIGFYRIGAIGKGVGVIMLLIISVPAFLLVLLGSTNSDLVVIIFLALLFILPIVLSLFALKEKSVAFWKRLTPLAIPLALILIALIGNISVTAVFLFLGIALMGITALIGKE